MNVIQVRPIRGSKWEVYESDGVRPFFAQRDLAISYARERMKFQSGEIHVFNAAGELEATLTFEGRNELSL
jgi:hypothetical protein